MRELPPVPGDTRHQPPLTRAASFPSLLGRRWSRFLDDDLREFAGESAGTIRAAADLDNLAPVTTVITARKNSAEVYADPGLLRVLTRPAEDHGVISEPKVTPA